MLHTSGQPTVGRYPDEPRADITGAMGRFAVDDVELLAPHRRSEVVEVAGSVAEWRAQHFKVVCVGEALLSVGGSSGFRPSGGALSAAVLLARRGLQVGLTAALEDDAHGRAVVTDLKQSGVDVGGIALVPPRSRLVASDARRVVPLRPEDEPPLSVPDGWRSELLLVSGLSPALIPAAALCRAARAARRGGAVVVVDINARRALWRGRDPRTVHAILREADVVRCSSDDLVSLWTDPTTVRAAMRESATFVLTDGPGQAVASGPFGEIAVAPREVLAGTVPGAGDAFTAALCEDLVQVHGRFDWERALHHAHAAAHARICAERF